MQSMLYRQEGQTHRYCQAELEGRKLKISVAEVGHPAKKKYKPIPMWQRPETAYLKLVENLKSDGYVESSDANLECLIIQVDFENSWPTSEEMSKLRKLESSIAFTFRKNGLGELDEHECGNGHANVYCFVANVDKAFQAVRAEAEKSDLAGQFKIAHRVGEHLKTLWPPDSVEETQL